MAKEKHTDPEKEAKKLAKAEKKAKRSETDGVHKSKSEKKEKKEKKERKTAAAASDAEMTTKLLNTLEETKPGSVAVKEENGDVKVKVKLEPLLGALVPFANPLADEKAGKKVLKCVKKGTASLIQESKEYPLTKLITVSATKNKSLKRGVKEVVKSLRKSSNAVITTTGSGEPPAIVILAADISPMDVISHIPVLCEDHGVPYIYVTSRAELGAAASTSRPTSVVMITQEVGGKKKGSGDNEEDYKEVYRDLVKIVSKASKDVRI